MNQETKVIKQNTKVEGRAAIYATGNVFKSLLIMSLPVLVLMLTNILYQLVDSAIAAQMISYTKEGYTGKPIQGSAVSIMSFPLMIIMMAAISLANMGFGTTFSQRLGMKDEEGAKKAVSTMHLTNIIILIIGVSLAMIIIKPWLHSLGVTKNGLGEFHRVGGSEISLYNDAILTMILYVIGIAVSSFQGIVSRQLRSEGHIKAASYLPLISIPFNIMFDIIFMGPVGMGVAGAALATLVATLITSAAVFGYAWYLSRKGDTYFSWSIFKLGVDWKLFGTMVMIGMVPFILQMCRAYQNMLSMHLYASVGTPTSLQLVSAITRPVMLIIMPAFAIIQTGGAMLGYNFGAKNKERVKQTVLAMFLLTILFALPQYILIIGTPKLMYWLFGASNFVQESTVIDHGVMISISSHQANIAYWLYLSTTVISPIPAIMIIYYMSTRKLKWALTQTLISFLLVFTTVILSIYFTIGQQGPDNFYLFFMWVPISNIISISISSMIFLYVRYLDNKSLDEKQEIEA